MSIMPFARGEIVTGVKNIEVKPCGRRSYYIEGRRKRLTVFSAEGIYSHVPLIRGLLKRKFVIYYSPDICADDLLDFKMVHSVSVILLEDYKIGLFDRGYNLNVTNTNCLKTTGKRIIDFNELPVEVQKSYYHQEVGKGLTNSHIKRRGKDISARWKFTKRCQLKIYNDDLCRVYATLNVMRKHCPNCSTDLDTTNVGHQDYVGQPSLSDRIRDEVSYRLREAGFRARHLDIFPVLYLCPNCFEVVALYSIRGDTFEFDTLTIGHYKEYGITP